MKNNFTKKAVVRAAAILLMLSLFGCVVAPKKNNFDFLHNTLTDEPRKTTSSTESTVSEHNSSSEPQELSVFERVLNSSTQSNASSSFNQYNQIGIIPQPISKSVKTSKSTVTSKPNVVSKPAIVSSPVTVAKPTTSAQNYIVGYYTSWSRSSGFTPDKINASKLTHIHYAFADISSSLQVVMTDPTTDIKNFGGLRNLKKINPALKIIISVGGWDNSKRFSDAALTSSSRETFAQSCLNFILQNSLDGVDLDWEYPVSGGLAGNIHRSQDKQNYTYLVQAIRQKLNAQTAKDGKQYFLTVTGAPDKWFLTTIEPTKLLSSVDYLFIMGYDLHGPWEDYTDFNAPLYAPSQISVSQGIISYLNVGVPAKKLVLGMPFYGYEYGGTNANNNGFNSTFISSKSLGYDTVVSKYLNNSAYTAYYDSTAMVPYLFGNNTFITYENSKSIALKAALAKKYGLAGVGAWELSFDRTGVLLSSAYAAFH